jgi:hypothetical protein
MLSLYEELAEKVDRDPRISAKNSGRQDLGILLFSRRAEIAALWKAAEAALAGASLSARDEAQELLAIVEKLRPIFGERG